LSRVGQVLLADDDKTLRLLLAQIITAFGFDVSQAENGRKALELFDQADGGFDLLVTDICMPEMDGSELIHAIRMRNQQLPIIVVTGFAEPDLIADVESCNAKLFVKPLDFKALQAHIDSLR